MAFSVTVNPYGTVFMAIKPIVKFPVASLKSKAQPVTSFDDDLRLLVADMIDTMRDAPGVGLAAPQIGVPLRVAVIAGNATLPEEPAPEEAVADSPPSGPEFEAVPPLVLVNPEIVAAEGEQVGEEGCLSVRDYFSNVKRFARIRVKAQDIDGGPLEFEAEDFFARVIQHELDHLDGTLFLDRLSSLKRALYKKRLKKILQAEEENEQN